MRTKILVLGIICLLLVFTLTSQELDKLSLSEIAKIIDETVAESGGKIKTFLKKENDVVNFYIDSQVKDYTQNASYGDYKVINAIVISVGLIMGKVSWPSDKLWFLKNEEKIAWVYAEDCKKILSIATKDKSEATSYLFKSINIINDQSLKKWLKVISWQGKGIKKTETFTITSKEWKICWATKPDEYGDGIFQIMVYKGDSSIPDIVANVMGKDQDCSFMKGKGFYSLTINAIQPWTVVITEKK